MRGFVERDLYRIDYWTCPVDRKRVIVVSQGVYMHTDRAEGIYFDWRAFVGALSDFRVDAWRRCPCGFGYCMYLQSVQGLPLGQAMAAAFRKARRELDLMAKVDFQLVRRGKGMSSYERPFQDFLSRRTPEATAVAHGYQPGNWDTACKLWRQSQETWDLFVECDFARRANARFRIDAKLRALIAAR